MSENQKLKESIESAWENIASLSPSDKDVSQAVDQVIKKLDSGELRIAEKVDNQWTVNQWLKKAVLISFRINENTILRGCLLYTSPSPRDRTRSRMPSSA